MGPKTLLALACGACLCAGAGFGILLDRLVLLPALRGADAARHESHAVTRLAERLDLDPAQLERVKAIFDACRPRYLEAMKDVRPRLRALHEEMDAQIRPLLRPEQIGKLEEYRREWEGQK